MNDSKHGMKYTDNDLILGKTWHTCLVTFTKDCLQADYKSIFICMSET